MVLNLQFVTVSDMDLFRATLLSNMNQYVLFFAIPCGSTESFFGTGDSAPTTVACVSGMAVLRQRTNTTPFEP